MRFSGRRDATSHPMPGKVTTRIRLDTAMKPQAGTSDGAVVGARARARIPTTSAPVSSAKIVASAREARGLTTSRGWSAGRS